VTRPAVVVRDAHEDDLPALLQLWSELRDIGGRMERLIAAPDAEAMRKRLVDVDNDPYARALVAVVEGEVAGIVLLTETSYAPLFDQRAVHAHYLHVREGFRRRGVGKALLAAAVAFAEETGAEHVMTSVLPQLRETQRFYARLGMSPVVVRRSAPVSMLRRRLSASSGATMTDSLLARRRTMRRVRAAVARVTD
jgi:GNAT superfamily N-acetyltransferase